MANSDKDILITPNTSTGSAPKIEFVGADATYGTDRTITLNAVSDDSGTITFLNGAGDEVFSINNNKSDVIFSVNRFDDSSTPLIEIHGDQAGHGVIQLARYTGQVVIGGDSGYTDSNDYLTVHKNIRLVNGGVFHGSGAGLTNIPAANLSGTLPAIDGNSLTNFNAANLTGTLPAINGASLTNVNATNLNGQSSANYLRSNTSDDFSSGTLRFFDNTLLTFGTSNDTIIEHDTTLNPDGTRFYANTTTGGMLFQDGSTTCFDVAFTSANTTTFQQTVRFNDNVLVYFGSGSDTFIRHNTTLGHTEFGANNANGDIVFKDGSTAVMTIGTYASTANRIQIDGTTFIKDDVSLCFGSLTSGDTIIKHNTSTTSTQFIAGTDGAMQFLDGSTICFDVAKTAADTTTFFQTVDVQGITKGTQTTNTNGTLDLSGGNLFKCTPAGAITLTLSNPSEGQAGIIMLDNSGGHTISAHASLAINADVLTALSTAGVYKLSYYCSASSGNDTILISATGALT